VGQLNHLKEESRNTPKVSSASADPPPVSVKKSLWINRTVRILLGSTDQNLAVSQVQAELASGANFKILKVCIWNLEARVMSATLRGGVMVIGDDDNKPIVYTDVAPSDRLPGIKFNIPDQLASLMGSVLSENILIDMNAGAKVADVTVRYQI